MDGKPPSISKPKSKSSSQSAIGEIAHPYVKSTLPKPRAAHRDYIMDFNAKANAQVVSRARMSPKKSPVKPMAKPISDELLVLIEATQPIWQETTQTSKVIDMNAKINTTRKKSVNKLLQTNFKVVSMHLQRTFLIKTSCFQRKQNATLQSSITEFAKMNCNTQKKDTIDTGYIKNAIADCDYLLLGVTNGIHISDGNTLTTATVDPTTGYFVNGLMFLKCKSKAYLGKKISPEIGKLGLSFDDMLIDPGHVFPGDILDLKKIKQNHGHQHDLLTARKTVLYVHLLCSLFSIGGYLIRLLEKDVIRDIIKHDVITMMAIPSAISFYYYHGYLRTANNITFYPILKLQEQPIYLIGSNAKDVEAAVINSNLDIESKTESQTNGYLLTKYLRKPLSDKKLNSK